MLDYGFNLMNTKIYIDNVKSSSKRAGQELEQESAKKQKLAEQEQAKVADDDTAELKRCLEIVPEDDDDVAIEATLNFNREDLEVLKSIVKERFKKTNPVDDIENLLIQTFKTMFKPHVKDIVDYGVEMAYDLLRLIRRQNNEGAPRENKNREPVRRNVTVEKTDLNAFVAQDGFRYDWSDQAEDGPTNFALMAYTSAGSLSSSNKTLSLENDNDDDKYDKESIISMNTDIFETSSSDAIMTSFQIEEPEDSLIMEDEDINTIPEKESDEENEYSVESLFHIPNESEVTFDNENPRAIKSLLNQDALITSPKIDHLLEEFAGGLALINPIPPGIDEINFDHEENICLNEKLLYDNSSPRLSEELNSKISTEYFSPSPIPVEDSDSLMEEIGTFLASNDLIPPGIYSHSNDSEEVNFFLEYEADPGELTRVVMEDIFREPRVRVPNVLPTHPTFSLDSDFTSSDNFNGSDLVMKMEVKFQA
nr:hypothetical protein [Tanacetum cinerariifolium]